LIPETRVDHLIHYVMGNDAVYGVEEVVQRTVFRMPEPHPDRTAAPLMESLKHLFADRPVWPLVKYDRAFAEWQINQLSKFDRMRLAIGSKPRQLKKKVRVKV
jgi:hypothetical protein